MRVVGVIALGLTLAVGATAASSSRPFLSVTDLKPFTVHGTRFKSGEHLRVVVTTKKRYVRRLEAGGRGGFTLTLRQVGVRRCGQYSVVAFGRSGMRAAVKSPPYTCGAAP